MAKKSNSDSKKPEIFVKFEEFAKRLLKVPKSELDKPFKPKRGRKPPPKDINN